MIRYDDQFNQNEWFVIISLIVGILVVYFLPQRFSKQTAGVYIVCGVFFGFFFDHSLSVTPVSFYDIGDTSRFDLVDFLSQLMYGPYGYLFFYLYDRWAIKPKFSPIYILVWAIMSSCIERVADMFGVYHYRHGYTIYFSFIIYLGVLSAWVLIYHLIEAYGRKQFRTL